jgi:HlyD family secretion protein
MKRLVLIGFIAGLLMLTPACANIVIKEKSEKIIPVEAHMVKVEERIPKASFIGTVQPGKTVQFSFKNGGRIESINVKKGTSVKSGDILAVLEKTDLIYAENLARTQMEMVQAQYEKVSNGATAEDIEQARLNVVKAQDAYQYALDRYAEVEKLYYNGTVSKQVFDQTTLEKNIREADLKLAKEAEAQVLKGARYEELKALEAQLESAKTEYEYRKMLLDEATLKSNMNGTVMEVLAENGEIIGAGYPVVVIRDNQKVVHVGIPEKELKYITPKSSVILEKDEQTVEARITRIDEIPDIRTGLYNIQINAKELDAHYGATVTVNFLRPAEEGIYIPISAILHDGQDYVYIVSEGKAMRKNITIVGMDNFEAKVTGLTEGDLLIVSGAGRISIGDRVDVKEE